MRGGDIPRRVQMRLYGRLREPLVGREPVRHEPQAGVRFRGDEARGQDAGRPRWVQEGTAAAHFA